MVARHFCYSALQRWVGAVMAILCALTAGAASAQTINMRDYFPLSPNSFWNYTGSGQPGSSSDDDFQWQVLAATKDIGTTHATQIKTITVEPTDSRNGDIDYWYFNPAHKLLYYGTMIASDHPGTITIFAQDVVLSRGLFMGGDGQHIGDQVSDSVPATVQTSFGAISGSIDTKVTFQEIVPLVVTRLGLFTNVLHVVITLKATVFGIGTTIKGNEFYLAKNVGMVKQDQNTSANQAKDQILKDGQVNGVAIKPDGKNAAGLWTLYQ